MKFQVRQNFSNVALCDFLGQVQFKRQGVENDKKNLGQNSPRDDVIVNDATLRTICALRGWRILLYKPTVISARIQEEETMSKKVMSRYFRHSTADYKKERNLQQFLILKNFFKTKQKLFLREWIIFTQK